MHKRFLLAILFLPIFAVSAWADEGMWLLPTIDSTLAQRLNRLGCTRVSDLNNFGNHSMARAVVKLGSGCTGSIIGRNGVVLTNYHCVSDALQQHSNAEHNLIANGFYAESLANELPIEGMTVAITTGMYDITKAVRNGVAPATPLSEAQPQIAKNIAAILDTASRHEGVEAHIAPQFAENCYILITQKVFRDVRLILVPPASIGKFGGDADNWQYPRHTGDFALLRIYSNASNEPADFSQQNKPYRAETILSISQDGYQENDLSIVMGYPAVTQRYATPEEIEYNRSYVYRAQLNVWQRLVPIWDSLSAKDPNYAAAILPKREIVANYLKYYQMQNEAIDSYHLLEQRGNESTAFGAWYAQTPERKEKYFGALSDIGSGIRAASQPRYHFVLLLEALRLGMPLASTASHFAALADALSAKDKTAAEALRTQFKEQYLSSSRSEMDINNDRLSTSAMLSLLTEKLPLEDRPAAIKGLNSQADINAFLDNAYAKSLFASREKVENFLDNPSLKKLKRDPLYLLATSITDKLNELQRSLDPAAKRIEEGRHRYMAGLLEQYADSALYPDADGSLRLSYGHVKSVSPADGIRIAHFTTVTGMAEKAKTGKPEYKMDAQLRQLQENGAFSGFQLENGQMPLNFITTNDIIGGNSGSPVMNKDGELIGLAFDCNSEGAIGQYQFNADRARCICVDIRFMLLYTKIQRNTRVFEELSIFRKRMGNR